MAETTVHSDLQVQQWADDEFYTYVRTSPFKPLMGKDERSVIHTKLDLETKDGDSIWFSLVKDLKGAGIEDDDMLEGNEEKLDNYGMRVYVHQIRNGVIVGKHERIKTKIDLWSAAKIMLRLWNQSKLRDLFIARFFSPVTDGLTTYAAAAVAQRNAWAVANNPAVSNQRILYGAAKANYSGVHATDLANVDATNDDLHQDTIRLLKRMAQGCDPLIRPVEDKNGEASVDRFVALVGSLPFRDLEANFETVESQLAAGKDENSRIMSGGDLRIGNVIVKEVPEMDRTPANGGCWLEDVGNGGTVDVEPVFFCGAQALGLAWAKTMSIVMDEFDYKNRRGVSIGETRGCAKLTFNSIQHGMATGWVSAAGD